MTATDGNVGRLSRRKVLGAGLAAGAATTVSLVGRTPIAGAVSAVGAAPVRAAVGESTGLTFTPIGPSALVDLWRFAPGYVGNVLIAWGDPIFAGEVWKHPLDLTAADQERRFGFNADYTAFIPFDAATSERRGLLWVNHEYTEGPRMFRHHEAANPVLDQVNVELAAHGGTVIEIERVGDGWRPVLTSKHNRRIHGNTVMQFTGPAAGHRLLQTSADNSGLKPVGMFNNCSGGVTPWGTILTCEENFNGYFGNAGRVADADIRASYARYGVSTGGSLNGWEQLIKRFDLAQEPNEAFRFGWVVEIDPTDPTFVPKKRTALGRMKHEAANTTLSKDKRVVVYLGDDQAFDYMYKFVSDGVFDASDRAANMTLLDKGTLYVAKLDASGKGTWIRLSPAIPEVGAKFPTMADVLIRTREAADLAGATKMDRPEDIEVSPVTGKVYAVLTNNATRGVGTSPGVDAANPRTPNRYGHIVEMVEAGSDAAATTFTWSIFMLCGPKSDSSRKFGTQDVATVDDISCPDNLVFDSVGNMWIACDGMQGTIQQTDSLYAVPTEGPDRAFPKRFMAGPIGCEITGPSLTPGNTTFFASVQHPGENGNLAKPESRWPDYAQDLAGRPAVVWVTNPKGDHRIGS